MKKIFISSTMKDFSNYRVAAQKAIEILGHIPIMAENFSSRAYSSETACINEVHNSDLMILVLGPSYGFKTAENISVTHSEYKAAKKANKPILVFIQDCEMEEEQSAFKKELEVYDNGLFRSKFTNPEELKDLVIKSIRVWENEKKSINPDAFLERIKPIFPERSSRVEGIGVVIFWPQPVQEIDLYEVEKNADEIFTKMCKVDVAVLRNGFDVTSEPKKVIIRSGKSELSYYSDGLISLSFSTFEEKNRGLSFDYCFVSPEVFSSVVKKSQIFVQSKITLCLIGLHGMEGRYFDEPIGGSSLTMPMFKQPNEFSVKLFNPITNASYSEWVDIQIKKFKRTYSLNKS